MLELIERFDKHGTTSNIGKLLHYCEILIFTSASRRVVSFACIVLQATKTITDDVMKPMPNWKEKVDGETHYIRGITYGGYLIVSMKFTAKEDKNIEDIKAEIEVHVNTKKVNVGVKGQFKSLSEAAASSSNLEISFTSSSIPNVMPLDLDTILQTIGDFPAKVSI
jgi:hypothetical protein